MTTGNARWGFFLLVIAFAIVLVLAVAQVPQPWRGILVAWLIIGGTAGFLALRLARHYHAYVGASAPAARSVPRRRPAPAAPSRADQGPRIVVARSVNGRRSI